MSKTIHLRDRKPISTARSPWRVEAGQRAAKTRKWSFPNFGLIALAAFMGWCAPYVLAPPPGKAAAAPSIVDARADVARTSFSLCGRGRRTNCVVDGDTFYLNGEKIRIADINAPEVSSPSCVRESELGGEATQRLLVLLNSGPFALQRDGRDRDGYGRQLRRVIRDGQSVGNRLVAEGLAHPWRGRKESWCG